MAWAIALSHDHGHDHGVEHGLDHGHERVPWQEGFQEVTLWKTS